jgi:beta-phosphoglucomutase family hydrolase
MMSSAMATPPAEHNSDDCLAQTHVDGQLQALIFDMDGVLCDTMPYHLKAWLHYSATIPELAGASREQLEKMGGKRNQELLPELLGHPVPTADIQRWSSEKEAVYRALIRDDIHWLPGLIPFLQQAQTAGLRLGLGTSACRENVDLLLSQDQLRDFFTAQVIETDVERGKPDPQCYLLVAERLGVAPEQCLVFEDAIAGVQAARNAAMRCWGVLTTHTANELEQVGAEFCIPDFTDPALERLINA